MISWLAIHLEIKLYYFSKISLCVMDAGRASGLFFAWPGHVMDKEEKEAVQNSFTKGTEIPGVHNPCNLGVVKVLPGLLN